MSLIIAACAIALLYYALHFQRTSIGFFRFDLQRAGERDDMRCLACMVGCAALILVLAWWSL